MIQPSVISPAFQHRYPNNSKLTPPLNKYGREAAVSIPLPGVDDPEERLSGEKAEALVNAIIDALDEHSSLGRVELLIWAGEDAIRVCLTPLVSSEQPESRDEAIPVGVRNLGEMTITGRLASARDTIVATLEDSLDDRYGIETGSVDFAPLGTTPIPASRLLLKNDTSLVHDNIRRYNPFTETIRLLDRLGHPFVLQTLVEPNSGNGAPFITSVRLAVMDPTQIARSRSDYAEIAKHGRQYNLADMWDHRDLWSNFDLDVDDFMTRSWGRLVLKQPKWGLWSDARRLFLLWEGSEEYRNLLAARANGYDAYETHIGQARIPTTDNALRDLAALPPVYYDENPWADTPGRSAPRFITDDIIRKAPGTDTGLGAETEAAITRDPGVANEGTETHQGLLLSAERWIPEEGIRVEITEQDTTSKPDGVLIYPDGEIKTLEAEVGDVDKPGNIGTNIVRAIRNDRDVVIITKDQSDADRVRKFTRTPWKGVEHGGVKLYTRSTRIPMRDGEQPVLPDGVSESTWILTGRTLELYAADDLVATGDAETPVETYEYHTPRLVKSDDGYRIVSPDGEILDSGSRKPEVMKRWTKISKPHVPIAPHYLDTTTIRYQTETGFETYETLPDWWTPRDGYEATLGTAIRKFIETRTVPEGEVRYDDFRELVTDWVINVVGAETDEAIAELTPDPGTFGRAAPDHMDTKRRDVDGTQTAFLRDRSIAFTPRLRDPDMPFEDDEVDTGEEESSEAIDDAAATETDTDTEEEITG